jgi:hypothetical protein
MELIFLFYCEGADIAEDICSLEKIGFLSKGSIPTEILYLAELFQFVLALIEVAVTSFKFQRQAIKASKADEVNGKEQRKLTLIKLEVLKYVLDIGKALYDCQFKLSHEGVFIICSLISAFLSMHKNAVKVLAP